MAERFKAMSECKAREQHFSTLERQPSAHGLLRRPIRTTCKARQDEAWIFMGQRFNARNSPSPKDHPERKTRTRSLKQKEGPNSPSLSSPHHSRRCALQPLIAPYHKTLPRAASAPSDAAE
mmetsp:Transcript_47023/g.112003  ORF Transcript_47023/g.112003 Transcript_47023/m.112003 type:complete len:121 (+) Transcript_47023:417-779(+)